MKIERVLFVLTRGVDPESWDEFMAEKPAEWLVKIVNLDNSEQKIAEELKDAQYLLVLGSPGIHISSNVLETAKKLKIIQTLSQGTDYLPVKWALEKGIAVANSGGANAIAVAEHTLLLILACLRSLITLNQSLREGKSRSNIKEYLSGIHHLYDRTVGIVGFGNIGRRVAKLCFSFGANIIYSERIFVPYTLRADLKAREVSLDELLSLSDVVTLHAPALGANRGMIGWEQLNKMKTSAYIINTSRSSLIDEDALIRALNEKKIAGAGLDVWEPEPPDPKNPLLQMPNVVATPHYGGLARESLKLGYETVWKNIVQVSEGKEPQNKVLEF